MKKPMGSKWTDEQWAAITEKGQDLLIAAAAGSGKTAVLVERIIRTVMNEQQPCDVDRLLVVTFTNAAAAEMKDRIRRALENQVADRDNASDHLRRQLALIHRASVTTLHSFCLDVIREHVQELDIDPAFRIANETEIEMIRQDIVEEMLEDYYANQTEGSSFWALVDSYSGQRSDREIMELIMRLYDFARSQPFPEQWLNHAATAFDHQADHSAAFHLWLGSLMSEVETDLKHALQIVQQAVPIAQHEGGPAPYLVNLEMEQAALKEMIQCAKENDWETLHEQMSSFQFGRLKPCKKDEVDPLLQEQVKGLREEAKEIVQGLKQQLFYRSAADYRTELQRLAPLMQTLVQLVLDFGERFMKEKLQRGMLDFSDLEHECLRILCRPDSSPDRLIPSDAALAYQAHFQEIFVDEYQDTNRVQEAILALVSRTEPGNRFMVGDVKQSIYRFRLAEPGLFLEKYRSYRNVSGEMISEDFGIGNGLRIDLSRNFRSRKTIVDGVNVIFHQIMNEAAFEIEYDESAALVYGAGYPGAENEAPIEFVLVDRAKQAKDDSDRKEQLEDDSSELGWADAEELEAVQQEVRAMILQMKQLLGADGSPPVQVVDKESGGLRPITYRDMVILLRATKEWAPIMMEEMKLAGIPCYAELSTGYFDAGEVELMISLLQVIDNPYQDIPLAAVLRSPFVGLSADEMARLRLLNKASYFTAVRKAIDNEQAIEASIQTKLTSFMAKLEAWRTVARQRALSELIATIYRDTGFLEMAGAMPGGTQRQANLKALYDRAKQYESTSYRGLFRFLRFIERMKDSGADLGTARALGEQEDVVRILSIHKSKGLEFPVVFVGGLGKKFNQRDMSQSLLMHAELGLGPKVIDLDKRVQYPSLPYLAIQRTMKRELLAEEMRVLYVALTRAKERLYLVGSSANLQSQVKKWSALLTDPSEEIPNVLLTKAQSYLDWIGPVLLQHPAGTVLKQQYLQEDNGSVTGTPAAPGMMKDAKFEVHLLQHDWDGFQQVAATKEPADPRILDALRELRHVPVPVNEAAAQVADRLAWKYPYEAAEGYLSKISVSELKRLHQLDEDSLEAEWNQLQTFRWRKDLLQRPRFLSEQKLSPAERGTIYHTVMQLLPLDRKLAKEEIEAFCDQLVQEQHLTPEQREVIDPELIEQFFDSAVGESLLQANWIKRELPFSFGLKASEVYPQKSVDGQGLIAPMEEPSALEDTILVQGVVDCIFETEEGLVLLDYKTDAVYGNVLETIKERYEVQISLYKRAIERIWNQPVIRSYLFLFDGAHLIEM